LESNTLIALLLRESESKIEEIHHESQALVVHGNPGYHHDGVWPALGTAAIFHSIYAGSLSVTDLGSSHDAYPHAQGHPPLRRR
jgi:hypothetical protein